MAAGARQVAGQPTPTHWFHGMLRGAQVRHLSVGDVSTSNGEAIFHLQLIKEGRRKGALELVVVTDAKLAELLVVVLSWSAV